MLRCFSHAITSSSRLWPSKYTPFAEDFCLNPNLCSHCLAVSLCMYFVISRFHYSGMKGLACHVRWPFDIGIHTDILPGVLEFRTCKSEIVFVHEVWDEIFIHSSLLCCFEELCWPLVYRSGADTNNISTQLRSIKNSHPSACLHESMNCHGFCVSVVRFLSTNIDKHSVASSFLFHSN